MCKCKQDLPTQSIQNYLPFLLQYVSRKKKKTCDAFGYTHMYIYVYVDLIPDSFCFVAQLDFILLLDVWSIFINGLMFKKKKRDNFQNLLIQ